MSIRLAGSIIPIFYIHPSIKAKSDKQDLLDTTVLTTPRREEGEYIMYVEN